MGNTEQSFLWNRQMGGSVRVTALSWDLKIITRTEKTSDHSNLLKKHIDLMLLWSVQAAIAVN